MLGPFEKALIAILLFVLMFGMGAGLTVANFRSVIERPFAPVIGLLSQFGWMPVLAWGLGRALDLPPEQAISLLVVGCVPGGTTSNLFALYARSDVALSISMTAISTVVAVFVTPFLLTLYSGMLGSTDIEIPSKDIGTTLAVMLVPLLLGMLVRARRPAHAPLLERLGSLAGAAVLALLVLSSVLGNTARLLHTPAIMFAASFGLGACGFGLGHLGAKVLRIPTPQRRAIALETGIQNSPLAIGIIVATFPPDRHEAMLALPLLYALLVLLSATALVLFWRLSPSASR